MQQEQTSDSEMEHAGNKQRRSLLLKTFQIKSDLLIKII